MCGVLSYLARPGGPPPDAEALTRALDALHHRGPDGRGLWVDPRAGVALGHTRLALVDPTGPGQPLATADGQLRLVINGELYGFEAQRAALEAEGHRFLTGGDSEVALHLYAARGLGFLEDLRGEFALVLWDAPRRRLVAARDRFGVKPLCFAETAEGWRVASEAKALFALGMTPAWDHEALFHALSTQYLPPDRTLFQGVRQVPPGHALVIEGGRASLRQWWDLDYPEAGPDAPDPARDQAHLEAFGAALEEATRLRLHGAARPAFHLSGGLDSSAVAALAAPSLSGPADCFTVSFPGAGPTWDEVDQARDTAAFLGARLHPVALDPGALEGAFADAVHASEGLAVNAHLPAKYLLNRALRAEGFRVALTGEGADEVLGGYAHLLCDQAAARGAAAAELDQVKDLDPRSAGIMTTRAAGLDTGGVEAALGFVPTWVRAKAALGQRVRGVLAPDFVARFESQDPFRRLVDEPGVAAALRGRGRLHQALYLWVKRPLAGYILRTLGDGCEMAHGVEGRVPFLDHRVFEAARRLPPRLLVREGLEKWPLRRLMVDRLPPAFRTRRKQPFMAPPLDGRPRSGNPPGKVAQSLHQRLREGVARGVPWMDRGRLEGWLEGLAQAGAHEQREAGAAVTLLASAVTLAERFAL